MTDTYTLRYITRGTTYTLNGLDTATGLTFHYLGDQGFGLAPLHRITTRGPLQHGDSDLDFRLDPRVLQLPLVVVNNSATPRFQHYEIREKLISIFRPLDAGYIGVSINNGVTTKSRNIDVKVLGGLTFDVDPNSYHVRTVVQLRADDPTWYIEGSTSNVVEFLQADFGTTKSGTNLGNWISYPYIVIRGPITNLKLTNTTTKKFIQYNGAIPLGTTVVIDLAYGKKTVKNNSTGANLIANISATSSLASLAMIPGLNNFTATGTGLGAASQVTITWLDRYTGI